ncbi:MAG: hypothetical protein A2X64_09070 [Ignavibacteria bacterium GWF2_33_9]|nr:MAG: hypothetical protein A2X64_09070 [Ignavibacteria bacterium GWF2_33_9]
MFESWGKYSDQELFDMIKKKDKLAEKAFSEIYLRYSDRIFNYCFKILGSYQDAKDVFQEVFVSFYHNIDNYELQNSLNGILFKIARNNSINYNRQKKMFSEFTEDLFAVQNFENENKEVMEMINKALDILPFHQKEAFILRHVQGLDYEEISKITMTNAGTIRNRVKRAIASLQKILQPVFYESTLDKKKDKDKKKVTNYQN